MVILTMKKASIIGKFIQIYVKCRFFKKKLKKVLTLTFRFDILLVRTGKNGVEMIFEN